MINYDDKDIIYLFNLLIYIIMGKGDVKIIKIYLHINLKNIEVNNPKKNTTNIGF